MSEIKPDQTVTSTVVRSLSTESIIPSASTFDGILWRGVAAIVAAGFFTWAGVVWHGTNLVQEQRYEMQEFRRYMDEEKDWRQTRTEKWDQQSSINAKHEVEIESLRNSIEILQEREYKAHDDHGKARAQ